MNEPDAKRPDITESAPDPPDAARPPWFRRVTFHSLLAALCPLIPIPFLDDRVLAAVRRRMVRELAAERGLILDAARTDVLAGTRGEQRGCLGWIAWVGYSLTVRLLGKLFRKVLILFAVKESVDTASRVFHEGYLLHRTFEWSNAWDGVEGRAGLDADRARTIRRAVETTLDEVDPRPLEQALRRSFRGSRRVLRRAARVLARDKVVRGGRSGAGAVEPEPAETEERRLLGGLLDRLVADLWEQRGYLEALEERYRQALAARPAAAEPVPGPPRGSGPGSG